MVMTDNYWQRPLSVPVKWQNTFHTKQRPGLEPEQTGGCMQQCASLTVMVIVAASNWPLRQSFVVLYLLILFLFLRIK